MSDTLQTQLVVIGAGPGGYAAAFHAAELGMEVTMVNADDRLGGVCLNRGCIPSKALLHVARMLNEAGEMAESGVTFAKPAIDLNKMRGWKNDVVEKLAAGVAQLSKARKVRTIKARAKFVDSTTLALEPYGGAKDVPATIKFEHAIVATGSRPTLPAAFDIKDERVMDSTSALNLPDIPKKLLVVGGGYIGLEMGTVYAALGTKVSVVEMLDGLLPGADRDLVRPLATRLEKQFDKIYLKTKVESMKAVKSGIKVTLAGEKEKTEQTYDRVLVSIGRRPNSENLGLENTKCVITEKGFIKVDRSLRTDDPHIMAIGDVAGDPMLAHKASREAKIAVDTLAGHHAEFDNVAIPAVVFTDPEIAWCGLTELDAKKANRPVKIAKFPWAASGRATTLGRNEGLTKILFDPDSERVLGVGMVGVGAGDMISEGVLAVEMAAVARDLAESIHPHPTLSETMMEAAEIFFGQATHLQAKAR